MPFDYLLGELLDAAFEKMTGKFKQDNSNYDFIKLIVDNAIGDTFSFILYDCGENFRWERKNWYKQDDISKISNPIESLKYIGQKIIPNILEQQGVTEPEESKKLFTFARILLKLDSTEKSDAIVIDGTEYLIQIKLADIQKEFKWKVIPGS